MRAVQFSEFGGPEVLQVVDLPDPQPAGGQIRVKVHAAGINPVDWKLRRGFMGGDLPQPTGREVAGVVDQVGDGVDDVAIGDRVFGFAAGGGGVADLALLENYAPIPPSLDFPEAAALPVAIETAARTLDQLGVADGSTVVINGAAGGVGSAAVQIARERGARVIGTASSANHDYLRSLGAEPTTYGEGLVARVRELAPGGIDAALDVSGHGALPDLVELTGDPQRVLTISDYQGAESTGVRTSGGAGARRALYILTDIAQPIEAGRFTLPVARTYSLDQIADAHSESEAGHVRGKLVVVI